MKWGIISCILLSSALLSAAENKNDADALFLKMEKEWAALHADDSFGTALKYATSDLALIRRRVADKVWLLPEYVKQEIRSFGSSDPVRAGVLLEKLNKWNADFEANPWGAIAGGLNSEDGLTRKYAWDILREKLPDELRKSYETNSLIKDTAQAYDTTGLGPQPAKYAKNLSDRQQILAWAQALKDRDPLLAIHPSHKLLLNQYQSWDWMYEHARINSYARSVQEDWQLPLIFAGGLRSKTVRPSDLVRWNELLLASFDKDVFDLYRASRANSVTFEAWFPEQMHFFYFHRVLQKFCVDRDAMAAGEASTSFRVKNPWGGKDGPNSDVVLPPRWPRAE